MVKKGRLDKHVFGDFSKTSSKISQRLAKDNFGTISRRFGPFFRTATVFGLIISENNFFFRICWFGGSKLEVTLRAAENFIRTPFYPAGKVDHVSQPGFK